MYKVLLVEDSVDTQKLVEHFLGSDFDVTITGSLQEAHAALKDHNYDLYLVDLTLPDGSGHHFCAHLTAMESRNGAPIIILTASQETDDQVLVYQLGADDFIQKPLDRRVFRARIENRLRKHRSEQTKQGTLRAGDLVLDTHTLLLNYAVDGVRKEVSLTVREVRLLAVFMQNMGQLLARDFLIRSVWGPEIHITDRVIDQHVSGLRKKLGPFSNYIQTIYGNGYQFAPVVKSA